MIMWVGLSNPFHFVEVCFSTASQKGSDNVPLEVGPHMSKEFRIVVCRHVRDEQLGQFLQHLLRCPVGVLRRERRLLVLWRTSALQNVLIGKQGKGLG